jgi:ubiquinone/menaquinone biosynthesis C-methylase UbiE
VIRCWSVGSALSCRCLHKDRDTNAKRYLLRREVGFISRLLIGTDGPRKLIDVGCGSGCVALPLHDMGFQVSGLDLNRLALTAFRQESKDVPPVQGDCLCLPFSSSSLDCIVVIHCFDHLDRVQFLHDCRRVLGQGGLLIFDALNIRSHPGFLDRYVNVFSYREVQQALAGAGFDIQAVSGYGWIPFGVNSESKLANLAARVEQVLRLDLFPSVSPRVLVAARKQVDRRKGADYSLP